jgi:hypothetical protein
MRFKTTEIVSLTVAFLAFLSAVVSSFYTYINRNRLRLVFLLDQACAAISFASAQR